MKKQQKNKLVKTLLYLYANNNFYKNILSNINMDINIDNIEFIYDKLPYIRKSDIIGQSEKYFSSIGPKIEIKTFITSGTSGQVLECRKSLEECSMLAMKIWKYRLKVDKKLTFDNYINLFSDEVENLIGHFYSTDKEDLKRNFKKIMEFNPRWISGPISIIEKWAMMLESKELVSDISCIKYIEFMGEYVDNRKRKYIEEVFECKTTIHYGLQEVWCVAYDAGDGELDILESDFYCEILEEKNGIGEIVISSFNNLYMPIIKYRTGDKGKIVESVKSEGKKKLIISNGRVGDEIYGKKILGNYFFDQLMWDVNNTYKNVIFSFRVVQSLPEVFDFYIVKNNNFEMQVLSIIESRMITELGENIKINYIFQDKQEFTRNGKMKKFISYTEVCKNKKKA